MFGQDSIEKILEALDHEPGEWAAKAKKAIRKASLTSLRITFRQIRNGAQCFRMEYDMTREIAVQLDFFECVRAVTVDKDNAPKWSPASLSEVTDEMVDRYFPNVR